MAPFPEYLSAVMSADASADAQARINIRKSKHKTFGSVEATKFLRVLKTPSWLVTYRVK